MIIDLASLDQEPKVFELLLDASEIDLELETARLIGSVEAKGEVIQRTAQTDVSGAISAVVEMDCVRCLVPVRSERIIKFVVSYVSNEYFANDREKEVTGTELDTDVIAEPALDLKNVVREQILLDLPIQVFCNDDCKGLCSKCGNNLNLIDCNCIEMDADPRWAALKNLR